MKSVEKENTILVVDDDPNILKMTRLLLQKEGYKVIETESGQEAIRIARTKLPDLILLDVVLPDISGVEVCRTLKTDPDTAEIAILLVSAKEILSKHKSKGLEIGADDYLARPIENRELLARVHAMLRLNRLIKQRTKALRSEIADRKKIDEKLSKSINEWQKTFNAMSDAIWVLDKNHRIMRSNRTAMQMFHCSEDELIGKHCWEIVHGTKQPIPECPILISKMSHQRESAEVKIGERFYRITVDPILDQNNDLYNAIHIITDITKYKQAQIDKQQGEAIFKALFAACGDGIIAAELRRMRFIEANPAICKMLGYSRDELLSKTVPDIHPADSLDFVLKEFNAQAAGKKRVAQSIPCVTKQGSVFYADISAVKTTIAGQECNIGFFRDITERLRLEEELQRTRKLEAIGRLAGGIAHDFNNMLGVITGNVSYSLLKVEKNEELYEVLLDIQEGARQAQNLTHQLLTFARGGAPIKETTDVRSIITESVRFILRGTKIHCDYKFPSDLWPVEVDPGQINQVFTNLFLNSTQAMPEGGSIQIKAENESIDIENELYLEPGRYIKVTITDEGVGISEKHILKIFDPYFSTKQKGKGLGLATTHSIIKKHNGQIFVESQIEKGTTFHIYLPAIAVTNDMIKDAEDSKTTPYKDHARILIMDDQEPILKMVGRILKRMGFETAFAHDGNKAIELYHQAYQSQNPFDAVILDLTVPGGMGGATTIQELLKIDPKVKAIVSSGYSNDPIMANYQAYGFAGVVPKPYTKAQLSEVLNKILGEKDNCRNPDS